MIKVTGKAFAVTLCLAALGACASINAASNSTRDGTPCTRDSEEDDCSRYVQYRGLDRGFRDEGFDEAHTKQGYESVRERRRERREGRPNTNPFFGGVPNTGGPDTE